MADEPFLSRWSRRKTEARVAPPESVSPVPAPVLPEAGAEDKAIAKSDEPLPPIESLTPQSDFTGFMKPDVDEGLKRRALRTLFQDPQFNVMDGLDTYIADYSQPDPIPDSWLSQLNQMARLGAYKPPPGEEEEKPAPDAENAAKDALEAAEKPSSEQGFADDSSNAPSDTPDGGVSPPEVTE